MKTYAISIGSLTLVSVRVRSDRAHDEEGQINKVIKAYGSMVLAYWQAQAVPQMERVYNLLIAYLAKKVEEFDQHLKDKHKEYMDSFPPHSIFCEKRCCQRANSTFWRYMKKELKWGADGHLL